MLRRGGDGLREGIAIDVAGAGQQVDRGSGVFVQRDGAGQDDRCIVNRVTVRVTVATFRVYVPSEAVAETILTGPVGRRV